MLTKSLLQCRACRLTWFPQGGAAGCPACGGTEIGGTLEFFHAGITLIVLALIGLFLRHGPLASPAAAPVAAASAIPVKQASAGPDHGAPATAPARVTTPARRTQIAVSTKKVKPSKSKRRQKKAKTRSKHVQR
jgi:hypothetical protein